MASELEIPSAFQQKLGEYYEGRLETYCHAADEIHKMATNIFARGYGLPIEAGGSQFWESRGVNKTQLNGIDIIYSLATERHEKKYHKDMRNIGQKAINLVINHEVTLPAAIILPPRGESKSASIVVGDEVNNPEHLEEITGVIKRIGY